MDDVYRYEIRYTNEQKTTFTYYVYTRRDLRLTVKGIEEKGFFPTVRKQRLIGFRRKCLQVDAV